MITRDVALLSLTLMSKQCLCQTFWESFFKSSPKQNSAVITNMASAEDEVESNYDNSQLDFKSWDSPYGLIQDVFRSDRKSRQLNWRNNDVSFFYCFSGENCCCCCITMFVCVSREKSWKPPRRIRGGSSDGYSAPTSPDPFLDNNGDSAFEMSPGKHAPW